MTWNLGSSEVDDYAWSVSELTAYIREMFEIDYRLQEVQVTGEISNFAEARSGHLYFTLKDDQAQLKCVMWRSDAGRLRFQPQDGDAIVAHGRLSVYEAGGQYQLYAKSLQAAGRGDLATAFELLKERLAAQGLFDPEHKQPLPPFPQKIGIVTSADAAALRDILNVLNRRWPLVSVLIAPTLVQGRDAPPQIVKALRWLDGRHDIDTIILARGGGSMEDLWAFNEEEVAQAIFEANHPIITGVGHETDFTITDFVADLRAPTPSAAAELAVPDQLELAAQLLGLHTGLIDRVGGMILRRRIELDSLTRTLDQLSPRATLDNSRQRLDWLLLRLDQTMSRTIETNQAQLAIASAALSAISPLATLSRGYAIIRREDGRVVRSTTDAHAGDPLNIQVADGDFDVTVNDN